MSRTPPDAPTRTARAALAYFALVFGAGFILGSIRVPFLVPRLGERVAELIEMPFMFVIIVFAARFIVKRFALPIAAPLRLSVGIVALALLLIAEDPVKCSSPEPDFWRVHRESGPSVRQRLSGNAGAVRRNATDTCASAAGTCASAAGSRDGPSVYSRQQPTTKWNP